MLKKLIQAATITAILHLTMGMRDPGASLLSVQNLQPQGPMPARSLAFRFNPSGVSFGR